MASEFSSTLERFESDLWHYHIPVSAAHSEPFVQGKDRRVICILNDKERFHAALMHDGLGDFFINVNKEIRKKLGLVEHETVHVRLEVDTSEYGMPFPDELSEVLGLLPEAHEFFDALTPGKKRSLIHIVGKIKSPAVRIRKSVAIANHLIEHQGSIDYKQLQEDMRVQKG